jgi:hypothetical protein
VIDERDLPSSLRNVLTRSGPVPFVVREPCRLRFRVGACSTCFQGVSRSLGMVTSCQARLLLGVYSRALAQPSLPVLGVTVNRMRCAALVALLTVLGAPSAHASRPSDGVWYGKITSVNVARRTFVFTSACALTPAGRWIVATRNTTTVSLGTHVGLTIYYRPNGDPVAGHPQSANLTTLASIANGKPSPDFPPGWAVTVKHGVALLVEESSGLYGDPSLGCVASAVTRRFINS